MQRLREEGESEETPVSVISNGMLPGETIVRGTVGTIGKLVSKNELVSPAIIVVGQTAANPIFHFFTIFSVVVFQLHFSSVFRIFSQSYDPQVAATNCANL